jgi:diguanylate cyclase (GGDEF)-like protein
MVIAEEIRTAISYLGILHQKNPHQHVTVSIGCACQFPQRGTFPEVLFTAADQALYEAKAAGRDGSRLTDQP